MPSESALPPSLPPVPQEVAGEGGRPAFGTYQGALPRVDLAALAPPYGLTRRRALLERKRWHYTLLSTPEVLAVMAVVDTGYAATGFLSAVDLKDRKVLFDGSWLGVPGLLAEVNDAPGEGLRARLRQPGLTLCVERGRGQARYRVRAEVGRLQAALQGPVHLSGELLAAGGAPPLTVVAPVGQQGVNVTQKWAAMLAVGTFQAGGRRYLLDGGVGGTDYTHGLLARHTAWRWAFACGRLADGTPLGLNLVEGFNEDVPEANENALWVGETLLPLPRARFHFNRADVLDPWRITTADGSVDLSFKPLHAHRERRDLKLVKSHFVQPLGLFSGRVRVGGRELTLTNVPGVTEDQDVLW